MLLYCFVLSATLLAAQDKVYFTDGSCRQVKVLEINPDDITFAPLSESGAPMMYDQETVSKSKIILVEYKSGFIEIYSLPGKNVIYNSNGSMRRDPKKEGSDLYFNLASVNSLALCNADASVFFERLTPSKIVGFGVMAAYNFNHYVVSPNTFLAVLYNAKKNYDAGAFINIYPGHFKRRTTFYFGAMFKYMAFNFDKVVEDRSSGSPVVTYIPTSGYQLATLLTIGTHSSIGKNFFFKTIAGLGGFKLHGDYKDQFNDELNKNLKPGQAAVAYNILPKFYFGLNFGFLF